MNHNGHDTQSLSEEQVRSRQRVIEHGEVFTFKREVNVMLDLVKYETERIDSRFLEPACGTGNFLAEILHRKLMIVEQRYSRSQPEYERYAVLAVSSIYGIDIQEDNVKTCRDRLYGIFDQDHYYRIFGKKTKNSCRGAVMYILQHNIIWGDALDLKTKNEPRVPIIFSEWAFISGNKLKRRDFSFQHLLQHEDLKDLPLWSDMGNDVYIPKPEKEYPPINFLELGNDQGQ